MITFSLRKMKEKKLSKLKTNQSGCLEREATIIPRGDTCN